MKNILLYIHYFNLAVICYMIAGYVFSAFSLYEMIVPTIYIFVVAGFDLDPYLNNKNYDKKDSKDKHESL